MATAENNIIKTVPCNLAFHSQSQRDAFSHQTQPLILSHKAELWCLPQKNHREGKKAVPVRIIFFFFGKKVEKTVFPHLLLHTPRLSGVGGCFVSPSTSFLK